MSTTRALTVFLTVFLASTTTFADKYGGGKGSPVKEGKNGEVSKSDDQVAKERVGEAGSKATSTATELLNKNGSPAVKVPLTATPPATKPAAAARPGVVSGPRLTKAAAPKAGSAVDLLKDAQAKAEANGMLDIAADIGKYKKNLEDRIAKGGVSDGADVLAQRMVTMVDSLIAARKEKLLEGDSEAVVREIMTRGGDEGLDEIIGYFGRSKDGKSNMDKEAISGLGNLVMTWKGHYDVAKKAGMSDTEAAREAGRKTDEWLLQQLGKKGFEEFCAASKAARASGKSSVDSKTHGADAQGRNQRSTVQTRPCPPSYMGVCMATAP